MANYYFSVEIVLKGEKQLDPHAVNKGSCLYFTAVTIVSSGYPESH